MPYSDPENQRIYARAHYRRNKPAYKARARAHTKRLIRENAKRIRAPPTCYSVLVTRRRRLLLPPAIANGLFVWLTDLVGPLYYVPKAILFPKSCVSALDDYQAEYEESPALRAATLVATTAAVLIVLRLRA